MDEFQSNMRSEVWFITLAPVVGIALVLGLGASRGPWTATRIAGLAMTIVGLVPLTIARFNLGDSFSIAPEARKLVTHGIYSRIRHPVYVFSAMIIAGIALYLNLVAPVRAGGGDSFADCESAPRRAAARRQIRRGISCLSPQDLVLAGAVVCL